MDEQIAPIAYCEAPVHLLVDVADYLKRTFHNYPGAVGQRGLDLAAQLMKLTEKCVVR